MINPPFGTREDHIDIKFIEKANEICEGNIYSLHKSSTREVKYIIKFLEKYA